jgi:uncharacterized phosphosugar-binding protein
MIASTYLEAVRGILRHHETTQLPAVETAADLIVASVTCGGVLHCSEIGHGIQGDFIQRAGGMMAVRPFTYKFDIHNPVPKCRQNRPRPASQPAPDLENVRCALRGSNARAGDVMMIGSVSGRNRAPVELALACRDLGVKTIGFTSLAYTQKVTSAHPSGQRLFEVVDVVLDNGVPYGDAAVQIPGYDIPLIPLSGVSCAVIGWLLLGRVLEKLSAAGTPASVFMSANRQDGEAYNAKMVERFEQRGY